MKKFGFRILAILLALSFVISLAACGEETPDGSNPGNTPDTPEAKDPVHDISEYSVVYSNKISYLATEAVTALGYTLTDAFGKDVVPNTDYIADKLDREILIGDTNRPESEEVLSLVTNDASFVIKTVGNKIVINAKDYNVLNIAVQHFADLAEQNNYVFYEEIEYVSEPVKKVTLLANNRTDFVITYPADLDDSKTDGSEKRDFEVESAYNFKNSMSSRGLSLDIMKDDASFTNALMVGYGTQPESIAFRKSLALNEYGFEVVGNNVVISGTNTTTTRLAITLFMETFFQQAKDGSLSFYDGTRLTKRTTTWNSDIPKYEGGEFFGTLNAAKGAFGIAYENTTAEEFEAYCKKLESEGYTLWQRHDIEDNLHATYTHEERGLAHVYFTGNEKTVRIITYRKGNYNLPENPTRVKYDSVTKSAVTQYGLDRANGSVGMCYVITLEDGSFIVVDSGTQNDPGTMHHEFYKLLQSLNKRPDGKIIIKAWYLTHEHGDHTQAFRTFMKEYGKKVVIEEIWCNPASPDYAYHGDHAGFGTTEKNYSTYKSYVNGDLKWIALHTGMEFYVANMKFEVLYTEEDFFPRTVYSGNDTCLVMKMTDTRSGTTMLWLGDTLLRGSQVLSEKYDTYLKSDFVQAAHHGKSEALPVYKQVLPSVVFWSCTTSMKNSQTTSSKFQIYWEVNKYLQDSPAVHITSDSTYTVYMDDPTANHPIKWDKK